MADLKLPFLLDNIYEWRKMNYFTWNPVYGWLKMTYNTWHAFRLTESELFYLEFHVSDFKWRIRFDWLKRFFFSESMELHEFLLNTSEYFEIFSKQLKCLEFFWIPFQSLKPSIYLEINLNILNILCSLKILWYQF